MKERFVDIMDAWLDARFRNIHTMIPGKIESYSGHTERKAKVKPLVRLRAVNGEELDIPPIDNVPVIFPSSGTFSLLYPLKKGDGCLILFSEVGIGAYLKGKVEVTADSLSKFALTDAICIPGLWSFRNVPNSTSTIEITDSGNIELNGNSKSFVTHAALNSALQTMLGLINTNFGAKLDGGGTPGATSLDISAAETTTIKTGG